VNIKLWFVGLFTHLTVRLLAERQAIQCYLTKLEE